jgi:hypothetical protein
MFKKRFRKSDLPWEYSLNETENIDEQLSEIILGVIQYHVVHPWSYS